MADPVLKPLVDRGLGPDMADLQQVSDGASTPGPGLAAARQMTGGTAQDASTAGGLTQDSAARYRQIPEPLGSMLAQAASMTGSQGR